MSAIELHLADLLAAARAARQRAYAPYSNFLVGAALLAEHGRIHAGCNVENAAYPQGQCAEATAIGALVMAGGTRILGAVVVGVADSPVTPCGGCRQALLEASDLAGRDFEILCASGDGTKVERLLLSTLIPHGFGPASLKDAAPE